MHEACAAMTLVNHMQLKQEPATISVPALCIHAWKLKLKSQAGAPPSQQCTEAGPVLCWSSTGAACGGPLPETTLRAGQRHVCLPAHINSVFCESWTCIEAWHHYVCSPNAGSGGLVAKDALGNDVKASEWLASHKKGDRSLTQGLKVGVCSSAGHAATSSVPPTRRLSRGPFRVAETTLNHCYPREK